jgi:hypothetical protein
MFSYRTTSIFLSLCLGLASLTGPAGEVWAEGSGAKAEAKNPAQYPVLISAGNNNVAAGKVALPFLISLAERPELLQPPFMRLVLGNPDRTRAYAYPSTTFTWTPADGSSTYFVLTRRTDARPPATGESRQLVAMFKHSRITLKTVRSRLGKPIRRYFDNRSFPCELYQVSPFTTLAVCEPTNSFDVSQITVCYNGPYLPQVSDDELARAESNRLKQIDHHFQHGNRDRALSLLQEHIADHPQDIKAHLLLASALRGRCDVNGSIAEYRKALAMAQAAGDVALQHQAIDALAPLGLMPSNAPVVRALSLKDATRGGSTPF